MKNNISIEDIFKIQINHEISDIDIYERTEHIEYNIYKIVKIMKKNKLKIMEVISNVCIGCSDYHDNYYHIIFITILNNWKLIIGYRTVCEDNENFHYLPILDIRNTINNNPPHFLTNKQITHYGNLFNECSIIEFLNNDLFYDKYYYNIIDQLYHLIDFGFEINEETNQDTNIDNPFDKRIFRIKIPDHLSFQITSELFGDKITNDILDIIKNYNGQQKFIGYHSHKYPTSHTYFFIIYYTDSHLHYCISNDINFNGFNYVDYDGVTTILLWIYMKLKPNSHFLNILSSLLDIDNIIHNFCLENPLVRDLVSSLNININDNIVTHKSYTPDNCFMGEKVSIKYSETDNDNNFYTNDNNSDNSDNSDNCDFDTDNSDFDNDFDDSYDSYDDKYDDKYDYLYNK